MRYTKFHTIKEKIGLSFLLLSYNIIPFIVFFVKYKVGKYFTVLCMVNAQKGYTKLYINKVTLYKLRISTKTPFTVPENPISRHTLHKDIKCKKFVHINT